MSWFWALFVVAIVVVVVMLGRVTITVGKPCPAGTGGARGGGAGIVPDTPTGDDLPLGVSEDSLPYARARPSSPVGSPQGIFATD